MSDKIQIFKKECHGDIEEYIKLKKPTMANLKSQNRIYRNDRFVRIDEKVVSFELEEDYDNKYILVKENYYHSFGQNLNKAEMKFFIEGLERLYNQMKK